MAVGKSKKRRPVNLLENKIEKNLSFIKIFNSVNIILVSLKIESFNKRLNLIYYFYIKMNINILGNGNLASQYVKIFSKISTIKIIQWYARSFNNEILNNGIHKINNLNELKIVDINFLMISDDAITDISKKIKNNSLTVHCAGSVSINQLKNIGRKGVFYPLQTFTKNKNLNHTDLPICIETNSKKDFILLEKIATLTKARPIKMSSIKRESLHLAATIVNNFNNHLFYQAEKICSENNVEFNLLHPLIKETFSKIKSISPKLTQTGPAIRDNTRTLNKHIKLLKNNSFKKIYLTLTESIKKNYEK